MNPTPSQLRWTGIFLACGIGLVAVAVVFLAGAQWTRKTLPLLCEVRGESVSGLSTGGKVLLRGIQVGSVTSFDFDPKDPERILIGIEVEPTAPVYKNATATMEIFGLTGMRYLELIPGDPRLGRAAPHAVLRTIPSLTSSIMNSLDTVAKSSTSLLGNLDSLTRPERTRQVDSILLDLRRTTRDFALIANDLRGARLDLQITRMTSEVDRTVRGVDSTLRTLQAARSLARFDSTTDAIANVARRADLMMQRTQSDLYHGLEDMSSTMRNLSDFSLTIRNNPSALLRAGERENP
jgi:phospholipid/cholesterol/gamma-HCH transport system substrate-binding protein